MNNSRILAGRPWHVKLVEGKKRWSMSVTNCREYGDDVNVPSSCIGHGRRIRVLSEENSARRESCVVKEPKRRLGNGARVWLATSDRPDTITAVSLIPSFQLPTNALPTDAYDRSRRNFLRGTMENILVGYSKSYVNFQDNLTNNDTIIPRCKCK